MSEPTQNLNPYTATLAQMDELAAKHPDAKTLADFPEFREFFKLQRLALMTALMSVQSAAMMGPPGEGSAS